MIADLQPAVSGPMTAEEQLTWIDVLLKSRWCPKSAIGCLSEEGLADMGPRIKVMINKCILLISNNKAELVRVDLASTLRRAR